jgi:hypothetical protein
VRGALAPILLSGLALAAAGCAPHGAGPREALPEFATPRGRLLGSSEPVPGGAISYRNLGREDFRGEEPPPQFEPYRERLGAATCCYVLTRPETRIEVEPLQSGQGWRGAPIQLGFRAVMDPECSWWNTEQTRLPPEYVLEHEQIHFALFELEARRLDARAAELTRAATVTAPSSEQALLRARQALEDVLARGLEATLRRNREFDEDTSMGFRPERQELWLERMRAELAATDPTTEEKGP